MNQKNNFVLLVVLLSRILSSTNAQNRVMGSFSENVADSRHTVAIFHKENYECVGSTVSVKLVLTVAHCVEDEKDTLLVEAGAMRLWYKEGDIYFVEEKRVHGKYNSETGFMDLAVLKVYGSFRNTPGVRIIELCNEQIQPRQWMTVNGWGPCPVGAVQPCEFLESKRVQIQVCRNADNLEGTILFAQSSEGTIDLRLGDTGAGGVLQGKLCAVAQRAMGHSPDIYIDITSEIARNFIEPLIEETNCN